MLSNRRFLQDIFDSWMECPSEGGRLLFSAWGEAILTVTQFDFLDLSGDLLGELYQLYFDRDTRKALGEFYTPAESSSSSLTSADTKGSAATDRSILPVDPNLFSVPHCAVTSRLLGRTPRKLCSA